MSESDRFEKFQDSNPNESDESSTSDVQQTYADRQGMGPRFRARSVAEFYCYRPPYCGEVFSLLRELRRGRTPVVLDAGCGPGKLSRPLAPEVDRVDAVDPSAEMLEIGRSLKNGAHPAINWICSTIEEAPLQPPYGLAVAGASFHWFAADRVLARLAEALEPGALLVLMSGDSAFKPAWEQAEREVMIEFVTRMNGAPPRWHSVDLEQRRLLEHPRFDFQGQHVTAAVPFEQSIKDYLACQHSRATFTLEAMGAELAREFDDALTLALAPHAKDGRLRYSQPTRVEWGFAV